MVYLLKIKLSTKTKEDGAIITANDKLVKYSTDFDELIDRMFSCIKAFKDEELGDEVELSMLDAQIIAFKGEDDLSCVYMVSLYRKNENR